MDGSSSTIHRAETADGAYQVIAGTATDLVLTTHGRTKPRPAEQRHGADPVNPKNQLRSQRDCPVSGVGVFNSIIFSRSHTGVVKS